MFFMLRLLTRCRSNDVTQISTSIHELNGGMNTSSGGMETRVQVEPFRTTIGEAGMVESSRSIVRQCSNDLVRNIINVTSTTI
jgi:hypothetical protein